jgi:DNA-binding PadR family transcriptional regulator
MRERFEHDLRLPSSATARRAEWRLGATRRRHQRRAGRAESLELAAVEAGSRWRAEAVVPFVRQPLFAHYSSALYIPNDASKPIRLTPNSYAVMAIIDQSGEATSYEIKSRIERPIQNFWRVPHATVYKEPARLAAAGYLSARQEEGGRRRRVYALTGAGREALAAWAAEPTAAAAQLRDEAALKIFAGADPIPLLEARTDWHHGKLKEMEEHLAEVGKSQGLERSERTLLAGIAYHRMMLEMLELLAQPRAA